MTVGVAQFVMLRGSSLALLLLGAVVTLRGCSALQAAPRLAAVGL